MTQITPEYEKVRHEETEMTQQRDLCEQKRNEIYAKQGRSTRFRTKEDRDQWIKKELKTITKAIEDKSGLSDKLKQELNQDRERAEKFKQEVGEILKRTEPQQKEIENGEKAQFDQIRRKDELQLRRNELWRQETQASQELGQLKDEYTKCEQSLRSVTGRPILQGIESIQSILRQFETSGNNLDVVRGYHGLLIDNIECDRSLFTAVETSVTSRLFYHIVDTDVIAMKLLKTMNQQKLHGEVNYLPLNVLRLESDVHYPDTNDAMPLIRNLKFDKKVDKAVRHVFDKILLCRNVESATRLLLFFILTLSLSFTNNFRFYRVYIDRAVQILQKFFLYIVS